MTCSHMPSALPVTPLDDIIQYFIGEHRDMVASHDDLYSLGPGPSGHFIGPIYLVRTSYYTH